MLLRGDHGNELELSIAGYQFPEERRDPWDSNALLVAVRVAAPEGTWEVIDPCLTTWEAGHLVRWLTLAAHLHPGQDPPGFVQPNLTLVSRGLTSDGRRRLKACFELERRPPWSRTRGAGNLCVDLDVDRHQLAEAAHSLAEELADFPRRGDDPTL